MKKKTYNLVVAIVGAAATVASALVAYFNPDKTVLIISAIGTVTLAITEVCSLFVLPEKQ